MIRKILKYAVLIGLGGPLFITCAGTYHHFKPRVIEYANEKVGDYKTRSIEDDYQNSLKAIDSTYHECAMVASQRQTKEGVMVALEVCRSRFKVEKDRLETERTMRTK